MKTFAGKRSTDNYSPARRTMQLLINTGTVDNTANARAISTAFFHCRNAIIFRSLPSVATEIIPHVKNLPRLLLLIFAGTAVPITSVNTLVAHADCVTEAGRPLLQAVVRWLVGPGLGLTDSEGCGRAQSWRRAAMVRTSLRAAISRSILSQPDVPFRS